MIALEICLHWKHREPQPLWRLQNSTAKVCRWNGRDRISLKRLFCNSWILLQQFIWHFSCFCFSSSSISWFSINTVCSFLDIPLSPLSECIGTLRKLLTPEWSPAERKCKTLPEINCFDSNMESLRKVTLSHKSSFCCRLFPWTGLNWQFMAHSPWFPPSPKLKRSTLRVAILMLTTTGPCGGHHSQCELLPCEKTALRRISAWIEKNGWKIKLNVEENWTAKDSFVWDCELCASEGLVHPLIVDFVVLLGG